MPRVIVSQDPVVEPASPEVTYDEMDLDMFRITKNPDGTLRLRANLTTVDSVGKKSHDGPSYSVRISDLTGQMSVTPKFEAAWDNIVDVMGLAYDFYVLRDKVDRAISNGEDATVLIAARNSALAALRAPV